MDIDKLNNKSLTKIIFYEDKTSFNVINKFSNGLLIAGDGVYYFMNNDFATAITKTEIPYRNLSLENVMSDQILIPKIRKPELEWLSQIIECFKYVNHHTKNELLINIYYSKKDKEFIMDIPENQIVSSASDNYHYKDFEYDDNYVRYLQIHSHNTMAPTPSPTDDNDDQSLLCYQGIIGNIQDDTDVFSVSSSYRYWTGLKGKFVKVDKEHVFNYPEIKKDKINESTKNKLNNILEESKKQRMERTNMQNIFPNAANQNNFNVLDDEDVMEFFIRNNRI